ncbi:MAG: hypothetical protein II999_03675 [Bacteroidaceae bacterium]|nr:hypothetical protein [Bacteroidaceae bacterium]
MKQYIIAILSLCLVAVSEADAQRLINVKGKVMQIVEKMAMDGKTTEQATQPYEFVHVYGLPDKQAVDYVISQFKSLMDRQLVWDVAISPMYDRPFKEAMTAMDGSYTVRDVPENGYVIFLPYEGEAKYLAINGMLELADVTYEMSDDSKVLNEVQVVAEDLGASVDALTFGDLYIVNSTITLEEELMKNNVRILIQPYYIDCNPSSLKPGMPDTVFLSPIVTYGNQNELTQERRLNFNLKLDSLANSLVKREEDSLGLEENGQMKIEKRFRIPDPNRTYKAYAEVYYEDYNGVLGYEEFVIKHCENKEPMKFLDYNFGTQMLDPSLPDFKVQPIESFQDATGDINLTFLNGKAELDPKNPNNDVEIARLQDEMMAIESSSNNVLSSLTVIGKASPEGGYEMNKNLARRRMDFALSRITARFSQYTRNRLRGKIKQDAIVAGWDEVADSLAADSMFAEAEAVRAIVAQHEGKPDQQYAKIRQLPSYNTIKERCLPKLRSVKYQYTFQTMRSLSDKEILAKWKVHQDSVDKKMFFDRYEYWRLTNLVKEPAQLPQLYKEYYEYTKRTQRKPDELAACNHAAFCIRESITDTTMLAPYIRKGRNLNYKQMNMVEEWETYNREAVVANQLAMYVLAKDYLNARIMSKKLPDNETNRLLNAFLYCLLGFYKNPTYGDPVAATSHNNRIVILIANGDYGTAENVCENYLEDNNPRKFYFLAQIFQGKGGEPTKVEENLIKCWKLDESFIETADADALFVDNKGEKKEFYRALDKFEKWKKEQAEKKNQPAESEGVTTNEEYTY